MRNIRAICICVDADGMWLVFIARMIIMFGATRIFSSHLYSIWRSTLRFYSGILILPEPMKCEIEYYNLSNRILNRRELFVRCFLKRRGQFSL